MATLGKLAVLVVSGAALYHYVGDLSVPTTHVAKVTPAKGVTYSNTPTLFIPGWGGNAFAYNKMIGNYQQQHYGEKVLTIKVGWSGKLNFSGDWDHRPVNPMIQVLFMHNLTLDYSQQTEWVRHILEVLKSRYGVQTYNIVAHSWGGSAAVNALILHGDAKAQPRLNKMVLLGAPVNEALGEKDSIVGRFLPSKRDEAYNALVAAKGSLTSNRNAQIYNFYGSINHRQSDGQTAFSQAQSLRALVAHTGIGYHEKQINGVSHYQLHSSPKMWALIAKTLWMSD
ncbi:alpha/beta fold hydrolase [Levilactobacillus bambusae]|nr:alpha/beta fold hydrolase [Levilactobacillus bambusae]